jgi:hypothetical protein
VRRIAESQPILGRRKRKPMKIVVIDVGEYCYRPDLDAPATNSKARFFCRLEGLVGPMVGFVKPWGMFA